MNNEILRYIHRLFEKQGRKLRNIVSRGVVKMVGDSTKMQTNQISLLNGEILDNAERPQQYGFSSYPQAGAECFVVFAGGERAHPLILSVDDRRYRIKNSAPGEVIIYTDEGDTISLKRNNIIEIKTKTFKVNAEESVLVQTKKLTFEAESTQIKTNALALSNRAGSAVTAQMNGGLEVTQDVKAGSVSLRDHVHGNVTPGGGNTGSPVGG